MQDTSFNVEGSKEAARFHWKPVVHRSDKGSTLELRPLRRATRRVLIRLPLARGRERDS